MRVSVLLLLSVTLGCATPVPVRFKAHGPASPAVAFSNPSLSEGDPVAGRRAFVEMQCIDCHRVAEDPALPLGRRALAGPMLRDLHQHSAKEVARRITSRQSGGEPDLFDRTMKDYAQPITARQLVDMVAYLRTPRPDRG